MSVAQLLRKAAAMGVTLRLDGDAVKVGGPRAAREAIRPELAAHKPKIIDHLRAAVNDADDCAGALRSHDGGLYLPWGPYLSVDDLRCMRTELACLIAQLSILEGWPCTIREEIMARATGGPLADLLPNVAHFRERIQTAQAASRRAFEPGESAEVGARPDRCGNEKAHASRDQNENET